MRETLQSVRKPSGYHVPSQAAEPVVDEAAAIARRLVDSLVP